MSACLILTSLSHTLADKLYDRRRPPRRSKLHGFSRLTFTLSAVYVTQNISTPEFSLTIFSTQFRVQQQNIATWPGIVLGADYIPEKC